MIDKNLDQFLRESHILTIATVGEPVWIYNVFYTIDDELNFVFASSIETTHGKYLEQDARVAFSITWVEDWNPKNKKGLQGMGVLEVCKGYDLIDSSIKLLYKNKGILRDLDTYKDFDSKKKMYKLKPHFMKYLDDKAYGPRGKKTFELEDGEWVVTADETNLDS